MTPKIRQVAQEVGATVIDLYKAMSGKPELFPDTVHPNAAGARLVAAEVYRTMTGKEPVENNSPRAETKAGGIDSIVSPQDDIVPLKQTVKGKANTLAMAADCGDGELVGNIIDGNLGTKYFQQGVWFREWGGRSFQHRLHDHLPLRGSKVIAAIQFGDRQRLAFGT